MSAAGGARRDGSFAGAPGESVRRVAPFSTLLPQLPRADLDAFRIVFGGVATPGDGQGEVNLDIDVIRAVAPKAQILDYEAPNQGSAIAAVINRIVQDGRADVASISWGSCELRRSAAGMARMASSMAAAAAAGVTVYVASGDHGAYGCIDQNRTDLQISVDSPAGDVNVIGVGGTYLSMLADGTYIDEVAWEEPLTGWAPGGGVSAYYPQPVWQTGVGVANARSNGMRRPSAEPPWC